MIFSRKDPDSRVATSLCLTLLHLGLLYINAQVPAVKAFVAGLPPTAPAVCTVVSLFGLWLILMALLFSPARGKVLRTTGLILLVLVLIIETFCLMAT